MELVQGARFMFKTRFQTRIDKFSESKGIANTVLERKIFF